MATSCAKDDISDSCIPADEGAARVERVSSMQSSDERIVLGAKLENPYTVRNMQIAADNLITNPGFSIYPGQMPSIKTTHYYVKFMPRTEADLNSLKQDTTLVLYEYPLDYELLEGGTYYHDPSVPDNLPTYQYASVPVGNWRSVEQVLTFDYEILADLCIPDEVIPPSLASSYGLSKKSIDKFFEAYE